MFPRIYLAVDNCFASKRWTEPDEWMRIVKDAGANYVEASADNECDPLYTPPDALSRWIEAVRDAAQRYEAAVCNLYSGHGTYTTLGLAHPDARVRDHIQHRWLEPMIDHAAELGAGMGFFCHAFSEATLADPVRYQAAAADLTTRLSDLALYARDRGGLTIGVEQMYSPHQIPWTIVGTQSLLRDVYAQSSAPFYITLDTGHQIGQRRFRRPSASDIAAYSSGALPDLWLGLLDAGATADEITAYVERHSYLFADSPDGELYTWLETLGAFAPILHLQQTDGASSSHRPFAEPYNQKGIVAPEKVLAALYRAYRQPPDISLPPLCADIYLTIEVFGGTAERPAEILRNIRESVAYWRRFIPEDGLTLDQLIR